MKKVLFVATLVRWHINMFHKPFIRWFHEQGWQVDVAANNDYDHKEDCVIPYCDNFHCIPFERSPYKFQNIDAYRQLKALLDKEHYDIIHCHTPMGSVITRLAAKSARNKGTKVIYTAHGFHFYKGAPKQNWLFYYTVEWLLSYRTDLLITMNQEDYRNARRMHAKRVELVNGVGLDLNRFTEASPEEKAKIRHSLGLKEDDIFAIHVAQLIPRKNHKTVIQAVKKLENPNFHLFICGDGFQDQLLAQYIQELGLEAQVHMLGFRKDVHSLCSAADLFLFASVQEGLPVAIMEAMACGLPIVASNIRGTIDLIDPGKGGYLVEPMDVDGFVKAIEDILSDKERLAEMKQYNLNRVQECGIEAVLEHMAQLYTSMME